MKIAAMKKEVTTTNAAAKDNVSGAVANMKLKHQTELNIIWFKFKNVEVDLGVERKIREGVEQEIDAAKKTVAKLRGKSDDLMVDAVKSGNSMKMMNQKAIFKSTEKNETVQSFGCGC